MTGTIKTLRTEKGFGFIKGSFHRHVIDAGGQDFLEVIGGLEMLGHGPLMIKAKKKAPGTCDPGAESTKGGGGGDNQRMKENPYAWGQYSHALLRRNIADGFTLRQSGHY